MDTREAMTAPVEQWCLGRVVASDTTWTRHAPVPTRAYIKSRPALLHICSALSYHIVQGSPRMSAVNLPVSHPSPVVHEDTDLLTIDDILDEKRRRRALYDERMNRGREARKPVADLPAKYDPTIAVGPPEIHFGLVLTYQALLEYANDCGLVYEDYPDDPLTTITCRLPVLLHLRALTDDDTLYISCPYMGADSGWAVVALYSNYTRRRNKFVDEDERDVLDILRRQLGLEGQPALWHWDAGNPW
ncbi:hypothetical protein BV25DRAFT_1229333 [Artomyces pyxidatus]|uniref:Uncharacterized protein n=1 Tax=Artomyces pyxidatus TaxID=48021 RepID=A0ACB8SR35_9AGAM|nr:hypothetical protein BV25DRAFT_1229333 [Artomyces pyxidatus]